MPKTLNGWQIKKIASMYLDGDDIHEIARVVNCGVTTVKTTLAVKTKRSRSILGGPVTRPPRIKSVEVKPKHEDEEKLTRIVKTHNAVKIRREYENGVTLVQLTKRYPWSEDTLRRVLSGQHPTLPPCEKTDIRRSQMRVFTPEMIAEIVAMRASGNAIADIARHFGVDYKSITYHIGKVQAEEQKAAVAAQPPKPKRETIFTWAAKWLEEDKARVRV